MRTLITLVFAVLAINCFSQQKAFPTAVGAGAYTSGGHGGAVIHVTNLSPSGAGSFFEAVRTEGPRTVVFDVSGTIHLSEVLYIDNPNLTIAGQTAPEGGITIAGNPAIIRTDNIIIRYIRIKNAQYTGEEDSYYHNGIRVNNCIGLILDHVSFTFNDDQAFTSNAKSGDIKNHTIQRCFFSDNATGVIAGIRDPAYVYNSGNMTFVNNLFADQSHRTPNMSGNLPYDVINNVYFNWVSRLSNINASHISNVNYIGNYLRPGSYTDLSPGHINQVQSPAEPLIYTAYNYHPTLHPTPVLDDQNLWSVFGSSSSLESSYFTQTQHPLIGESFPIKTAAETYTDVLGNVGANKYLNADGTFGKYLDSYDALKISNVIKDISTYPYDKSYVLPTLPTNTRGDDYYVSDPDIPETWYLANVPDGAKANDLAPSGYTWLEEFINEVDNQDTILQVQACTITTPPIIDGAEDDIWSKVPSHKMGVTKTGETMPDPMDLSASFKIAWDVNSLYFFVKVKDDILFSDSPQLDFFRDDAVSIFIDASDNDSETYDSDDYYIGMRQGSTDININGSLYEGSEIAKTDVVTADGYQMEVKIDWSYLGIVPGTNNIGLDFRVDDDDDGGSRENHVLWNDETSTLYSNPSKFGILTLIDQVCDRCYSKNAPVVSLASPMAAEYFDNDTVSFNISYTSDTILSSVSYYLDGSLERSLIASPFSFDTAGLDLGNYIAYAVVEDACGKSSSTSQVFFTVSESVRDSVLQVQACKISAPPVIDGTEDNLWGNIPSHNMGVTEVGLTFPDPNDLSASFKIAWDVNSLYFFVSVTDDILFSDSPQLEFFRDDALSIFIDALDNDSETYDPDDYYIGMKRGSTDININNSLYVGSELTKGDIVSSDGYQMEVKIDWSYLGIVPGSDNIGLDFRVDDDDDGGSRENHVLWNDESSTLWNNPSKFGILNLTDDACPDPDPDLTNVSSFIKEEFSIYPNPASSEINIRTSGINNHFVSIYNSLGQEVFFSRMNTSTYNLDIRSWKSGIYLIILKDYELNPLEKQKLIVE